MGPSLWQWNFNLNQNIAVLLQLFAIFYFTILKFRISELRSHVWCHVAEVGAGSHGCMAEYCPDSFSQNLFLSDLKRLQGSEGCEKRHSSFLKSLHPLLVMKSAALFLTVNTIPSPAASPATNQVTRYKQFYIETFLIGSTIFCVWAPSDWLSAPKLSAACDWSAGTHVSQLSQSQKRTA